MTFKLNRKELQARAAVSVLLAGGVALLSEISFVVAVAVLLLNGPVADIIIEAIASRTPGADSRITQKSWGPVFFAFGVVVAIAACVSLLRGVAFSSSLAYALLSVTSVGAVLGIINEWADEW